MGDRLFYLQNRLFRAGGEGNVCKGDANGCHFSTVALSRPSLSASWSAIASAGAPKLVQIDGWKPVYCRYHSARGCPSSLHRAGRLFPSEARLFQTPYSLQPYPSRPNADTGESRLTCREMPFSSDPCLEQTFQQSTASNPAEHQVAIHDQRRRPHLAIPQ